MSLFYLLEYLKQSYLSSSIQFYQRKVAVLRRLARVERHGQQSTREQFDRDLQKVAEANLAQEWLPERVGIERGRSGSSRSCAGLVAAIPTTSMRG